MFRISRIITMKGCSALRMSPISLYELNTCNLCHRVRLLPASLKRLSFLASLSNRTLLVNNLLDLALYAGNRVVSAVGMKPPHDGRSRMWPPKVLHAVRIGRNEATGMASPTSRQGHRSSTSEERTTTVSSLFDYGVVAPSAGLNGVADFHMA